MKKAVKIILIIILVFAVLAGALAAYMNGIPVTHKGLEYAEKYRSDAEGDLVYFTEEDFGEYAGAEFAVKDRKGLFRSTGSVYTVTYSEERYNAQMQKISGMDFLEDIDENNSSSSLPAVKAENGGWVIRVVAGGDYPKAFAMIGTNDSEKTIAYMYFTDADLDYISEAPGEDALIDFIEENFSFEF